jgi:hypothetical protein
MSWKDEEFERMQEAQKKQNAEKERKEKIEHGGSSFYHGIQYFIQKEINETNEDGRFACFLRYEERNTTSFYIWDAKHDDGQRTIIEHHSYPQSIEIKECSRLGGYEHDVVKTQRLLIDLHPEDGEVCARTEDGQLLHESEMPAHLLRPLLRRTNKQGNDLSPDEREQIERLQQIERLKNQAKRQHAGRRRPIGPYDKAMQRMRDAITNER